ncbi:efflux RND transporter periplasmic adaptor subunit [Sunxiuqinia sp. A32]|uniref:efflux RND transporter periplasmic adaptor subunit n=1 Tax=Sunxiuqinia sp. A32 TaxID=3461496 RepID=UPI0040452934
MKRVLLLTVLSTYIFAAISCGEHKHNENNEHQIEIHEHNENHDHEHEQSAHILEEKEHEGEDHLHEELSEHEHDLKYGVIEVDPVGFQEVIHTSGVIIPAQSDEQTLTAIHDGIVVFGTKSLLAGKEVKKGEILLTISGKGLIHDNIENTFRDSKSEFETAQSNYERAKILNEDKITSDKDLADIEMTFLKAKNNYEIVKQNYSSGGQKVAALSSGYIKDIIITEGQYVTTGQPLLRITQNKRLVVKADVPQRFFSKLKEINTANFITPYDQRLYKTSELNGKFISYGKSTLSNSLFTPIYFEIDNVGSLLSGSFVEIFLKTASVPNSIVIPKTAILEEAGNYYVYAEGHDGFEKRMVSIDCHDGESFHISSGLKQGDHIATKNVYQIKLASLSSSLPAHTHQH